MSRRERMPMPDHRGRSGYVSIRLTEAQRKAVAEIIPALAGRLKLDERDQRPVELTPAELEAVREQAAKAVDQVRSGMRRNSLRHVSDLASQALERHRGIGAIPRSRRVYQWKITLEDCRPTIWRRIQVKHCTLDKLHERIQTSMGWTNSHLHHFLIGERSFGDPVLMDENFDMFHYEDSTRTWLDDILPKTGERFRFRYEYDFGDSWWHEVLFEGCLQAEPGIRYPRCTGGARACPPEDVGGVGSYAFFLDAIRHRAHEMHDEFLSWVGGSFHPAVFDAEVATKQMHRGIFNWRREELGPGR